MLAQQPLELRRREVRIRNEPRAPADQLRRQLSAPIGCAAVLPDDRVVHRLSRAAVPEEGRLPLVRDADRGRVLDHRLRSGGEHALPDLFRVVLDPPGLRVVLLELRVPAAVNRELLVDEQASGAARALVDREDHCSPTSSAAHPLMRRIVERVGRNDGRHELPEHVDMNVRTLVQLSRQLRECNVASHGEPVGRAPDPPDDLASTVHRLAAVDGQIVLAPDHEPPEDEERVLAELRGGA